MKKKLLLVLIIICSLFTISSCKKDKEPDVIVYDTKRVVLFIGDGMGFNHINVSEAYFETDYNFTNFSYSGEVITQSLAASGITDSAAAATAMATGEKVSNSAIAMKETDVKFKYENIKSISEYAKEHGYGVGIVTSDTLNGATPAAFSAHAQDRGKTLDILKSQISSNIDLLIGEVNNVYEMNHVSFIPQGYTYVTKYEELDDQDGKILACFEDVGYDNHSDTTPTLTKLTEFAIEYFERNYPQGYFLMIEGAHIDKVSHNNDIIEMVKYLNEFSSAIDTAKRMLDKFDSYTILVTADHECGDLQYNGESKEQITKELYNSKDHTKQNVPYYFELKLKDDRYDDLVKVLLNTSKVLDNTDIFRICKALLNI